MYYSIDNDCFTTPLTCIQVSFLLLPSRVSVGTVGIKAVPLNPLGTGDRRGTSRLTVAVGTLKGREGGGERGTSIYNVCVHVHMSTHVDAWSLHEMCTVIVQMSKLHVSPSNPIHVHVHACVEHKINK